VPIFQAIYVYGFGVPLFIDEHERGNRVKWGLWILNKLLLSAVYGFILFMHHSKWGERLPGNPHFYVPFLFFLLHPIIPFLFPSTARPAFYNYICAMFLLNAVSLFACVLAENGAGLGFGYYFYTF